MFNPRSNGPFGRNTGMFGSSRYQYQQSGAVPYEGAQTSSLISKVMGLLAFSFLFASIGTFVGTFVITSIGTFWIVALAGLAVLFILNFAIQKPGLNLFLLYLFTFLEGMAISPIIGYYLHTDSTILGEAFLITTITSFALVISVFGIAIFSGYVLYYVQRAKYMADTMPNAIGLTVSIFITVLNLFLYILELLSILQGGNRRR